MPLLNGRPIPFVSHPTDLTSSTKVFHIRFTGEVFKQYEEYSARLDFYRQSKFACKYTGKTGFTYEQALSHETQSKASISEQIPSQYLPIILETIQFSQLKLTELVNAIHQKLIDHVTKPQPTANDNNNSTASPPKQTKKASKKAPLKKTQIRTQIRVAANQQKFKNAPWILNADIAKQYNISKEMPPHLQALITQYLEQRRNKNKKRSRSKSKGKSTEHKSKKKAERWVKPETLISALSIQSTTKSLKYPCEDQFLLMYDKLNNDEIIRYDAFWNNIHKIGISSADDGSIDEENYSNLAFIDYNLLYDVSENLRRLKHRQLNDMFHEIWKVWSFVEVFHDEIGMTPFPISYLMDALCYDKRCVLMDELMLCLLDMIRKHFIWYLDQQSHDKKQAKRKQIMTRNRARKRKRERAAKQNKPKSDKQEMDISSEDEETESEEATDSDEEDYEPSETDESSMDLSTDEEEEENEIMMDILSELGFTRQSFNNGFRLEILRNYLQFRCNSAQEDDDREEAMAQDVLPPNTSVVISDEIWDRLCNIRQYITLGIEAQLQIIKILFADVQHTHVLRQIMNDRITRYQAIKQEIKGMEEAHSRMVKEEKSKLRTIRSECLNKKKILKNKKQTATSTSASSSASSSSSSASSSLVSKASSVSPKNKENHSTQANATRNNSIALKGTSRQQEMARKKEEKEKEEWLAVEEKEREDLKRDIAKLENKYQIARDVLNATVKEKESAMMYRRYELWMQCRTHLMELGTDRFNNKYFWNMWSDGRIFVLHSNGVYHEQSNANVSVTQKMMKLNECDGMKCYNEWEVLHLMNAAGRDDDNTNNNTFCWSYVSTSTQFYNLLTVLDARGTRESKLLLMLKALRNDIVASMKRSGNDDYKEEEGVSESMDVDMSSDEAPKQLRRSKRATKQMSNNNLNAVYSNKGFLTYRNKIKRK